MSEIRRVLLSRKNLLYLLIAAVLGSIFFMYDLNSEKQITLTGEELSAYIEGYPDFLKSVKDNAESFGTIAALSDGFSAENIRKTAEDYEKLAGVSPVYGENRGIVLISDYVMGDFLIIAVVLLIAVSFTEEQRKGLTFLVRSTEKGRVMLSVQRIGIIFIISLGASAVVYGSLFLTAQLICGDMEVLRPLQSVPEFSLCPFEITIMDYLLLSALIKALGAAAAGLALYLLPCIVQPAAAMAVFGVSAAAEYLLYSLILPTDRLSGLKFCNIAALLRTDIFFKEYCNLNILGRPVSFLLCAAVTGVAALMLLSSACLIFSSKNNEKAFAEGGAAEKLFRAVSRRVPVPPLALWEAKKVFINGKGIIVLGLVIYIAVSSALQYRYLLPSYTKAELSYYNKYSGTITEEMMNGITNDRDEAQEEYDLLAAEYLRIYEENGKIITDEMLDIYDKMQVLDGRLDALDRLFDQAESGLQYTAETGIEVDMIKTAVYELLLLDDKATTNKNALYIILAVIGVFAGICANENRCNMNSALKSSLRGRGRLTAAKLAIIGITCAVTVTAVYLPQILQIGAEGYNDINAAAQSLEFLRFMPFEISIKGYLLLMLSVRILSAFLSGAIVMLISRFCRSPLTAVCISAAILAVPAVLSGTGAADIPSIADWIGFCTL